MRQPANVFGTTNRYLVGTVGYLLVACAADGGVDDQHDLSTTEQAIVGGQDVPNNTVAPYSAAVQLIDFSLGMDTCSAVKISDNPDRYVTAAHCLRRAGKVASSNGGITITNGSIDNPGAFVTGWVVHPSWRIYMLEPTQGCAPNCFAAGSAAADVAVVSTRNSNSIPHNPNLDVDWTGTGTAVTAVGFGSGEKQYGTAATQALPGSSLEPSIYVAWSKSGLSTQAGDSGSPLFRQVGGTWRINGTLSGFAGNSYSRISNVKRWIDNPATVSAANGFQGMLLNSRSNRCMILFDNTVDATASQYPCLSDTSGTPPNYFTLVSTGTANEYQLRSKFSRCLGVRGNSNADGARIDQQVCSSSNYQKFLFTAETVESGLTGYKLRNRGSNKCIKPEEGVEYTTGSLIKQYGCTSNSSGQHGQRWVLTR